MKKVFILFLCALFTSSCDDGNLTLETIDFETATTQTCDDNNIIFKLKDKEALLLEIPKTNFLNEPTDTGKPIEVSIDNTTTRVIYRFYNGSVSTDNICNSIAPATPYITDQWTATSGKIEITTTTITAAGSTLGSTKITGYNHHIVFKNITFAKKNGTQVYETFVFGDYITTSTSLSFNLDTTVEQCTASKMIYNYNSSEALTLENIDTNLIINSETPANTPRTALIGNSTNQLYYRSYNGLITSSYFCNTTTPSVPTINEEWMAIDGLTGSSGIIEVTTVKSGTTAYKHSIVIKNATLKKGNSSFKLGDSFLYGELTTF